LLTSTTDVRARTNACLRKFNIVTDLLYFNRRARVFELLFDFCRLFLVDTFLDGLRRSLHEILGLLQAETRDGSDFFDHVDLLLADGREDYIELGFFYRRFGGGRGGAAGSLVLKILT